MQSVSATTLPARSSWAANTPESTMPIRTPAPVVRDHAAGAPICWRAHWDANMGSCDAFAGWIVSAKSAAESAMGPAQARRRHRTPALRLFPFPKAATVSLYQDRRRPLARTRRTPRTLRPGTRPRRADEPNGRLIRLVLGGHPGAQEVERRRGRVVGRDLLVEEELEREPGQHQRIAGSVRAAPEADERRPVAGGHGADGRRLLVLGRVAGVGLLWVLQKLE